MIGPPLRKLSTKKFLSNALSGTAGVAAGATLAAAAGEAIAVVVAGDITAVAGVVPGTGGLIAVAGEVTPGGLAGDVPAGGGGGCPKEVNTSVTEQRLAISSVFIGWLESFFPGSNSDEDLRLVYPQRDRGESSKTFAFVFSTFGSWRTL
jgi:hypothetical protein